MLIVENLMKPLKKYHFPLLFIDQMLEKLAGKTFYCCLNGYSGYLQIPVAEKGPRKNYLYMSLWTFCI